MVNYYQVLKVSQSATIEEIQEVIDNRYNEARRRMGSHDPKKAADAQAEAALIEKIRSILTDPEKRQTYDGELEIVGGLAANEDEAPFVSIQATGVSGSYAGAAPTTNTQDTSQWAIDESARELQYQNESKRIESEKRRVESLQEKIVLENEKIYEARSLHNRGIFFIYIPFAIRHNLPLRWLVLTGFVSMLGYMILTGIIVYPLLSYLNRLEEGRGGVLEQVLIFLIVGIALLMIFVQKRWQVGLIRREATKRIEASEAIIASLNQEIKEIQNLPINSGISYTVPSGNRLGHPYVTQRKSRSIFGTIVILIVICVFLISCIQFLSPVILIALQLRSLVEPDEIAWVTIPAGSFVMGSAGNNSPENEKPAHEVEISYDYSISKYEISYAQYQLFVNDTSISNAPRCNWTPIMSFGWINRGFEDRPVVCITWEDAVAYTEWLSRETGNEIRLPTEAEWEKAAKGTIDERLFPWGDSFDPANLNFCDISCKNESNYQFDDSFEESAPIGSFPKGASPFGVEDMAGNVWEYTISKLYDYPYDENDGRNDLSGIEDRVLRGGSFANPRENAFSVSARGQYPPDDYTNAIGFRVVMIDSSDTE